MIILLTFYTTTRKICLILFSKDVHECSTKTDNCHTHANCTNSKGSFICTCKNGFKGNGSYCEGLCRLSLSLLQIYNFELKREILLTQI